MLLKLLMFWGVGIAVYLADTLSFETKPQKR